MAGWSADDYVPYEESAEAGGQRREGGTRVTVLGAVHRSVESG